MTHASAEEVQAVGRRARVASAVLRTLHRDQKDAALRAIADALIEHTAGIIAANDLDVQAAQRAGTDPAIIDRLTLTEQRLSDIAAAVRQVAALPDPVGDVLRGYTLPNGLKVRQVRVPLGVVGMIYEARPNVTVDAAVLALKSGNVALLRGSSSAFDSNTVLVDVMREALGQSEITPDAILLVPGTSHESVKELLTARGFVDVIIPRGGAELINSVVENATVPVIETGVGNCHVYVDADADVETAVAILLNAKTQRPSVCNAAESLLVHADIADRFLPVALTALAKIGRAHV